MRKRNQKGQFIKGEKIKKEKHNRYRHGMFGTRPYAIWCGMKRRCYNKNEINYARYGGKGIKMCKEWLDFVNFWNDMKDGYFENASIDRIKNGIGYFKVNCRWIKLNEQSLNRSQCRYYTHKGITDTIAGWERRKGFKRGTLRRRLNYANMTFEDAITKSLFSGTHKYKNTLLAPKQ